MTKKANFILSIISALILTALISHERAFALLAIPFLFLLGAGLLTFSRVGEVYVSRTLTCTRGKEGQVFGMSLTVTNTGTAGINLGLDEGLLPGMELLEGRLKQNVTLPAGCSLVTGYTFSAKRGRYRWNGYHMTRKDLFGFIESSLDVPAVSELIVLPEAERLRNPNIKPQNTLHTPGLNLSHQPGTGTDFWGVREYHSGDSMRWIDWRHSARQPNKIITKEFEREEIADIGILLDARRVTNRVPGMDDLFERSVRATLSLAESFIRSGNRVSLMVLGRTLMRVFPGSGKQQLIRIQEKLAACELSDNPGLDSLRYLPVKLFPSRAMVVLVSPLRSRDAEVIKRMHGNGYQVIVLSPDPLGQLLPEDTTETDALAFRAARLERAVLLWQIRRLGVEVIDWPANEPLQAVLQASSPVQRRLKRIN